MQTNELRTVVVRLRNSGRGLAGKSGVRPVMLAYHWFDPGKAVVFDGLRTPLPYSIPPGGSVEADGGKSRRRARLVLRAGLGSVA